MKPTDPEIPAPEETSAVNPVNPVVLIGLGGAGGNMIHCLAGMPLPGVKFVAANTDESVLNRCEADERFLLGKRTTRGLGAGGDPERGRLAAEEDANRLAQVIGAARVVIILAGMGGGTGTGAAPVVARVARECNAMVVGLVTMPFEFEGPRREAQAVQGLQALKEQADGVICVSNERATALVASDSPVTECFQEIHRFLGEGVIAIWRLVNQPGLINVDFADLQTVLRHGQKENLLAVVEVEGEDRCERLIAEIRNHPMLDGADTLKNANSLLVSVQAGPDVTMKEIRGVMDALRSESEHAEILFGASVIPELRGRLGLTVVVGGRGRFGRSKEENAGATEVGGDGPDLASAGGRRWDPAAPVGRSGSRFLPPPPELSPDKARDHFRKNKQSRGKGGRAAQGVLPLEVISKGRFERTEPTVYRGENLDEPTYIRRGAVMN